MTGFRIEPAMEEVIVTVIIAPGVPRGPRINISIFRIYTNSSPFLSYHSESSILDHVFKGILIGKGSNALDEILIGVPVASDDLAHHGDHLKGVGVV